MVNKHEVTVAQAEIAYHRVTTFNRAISVGGISGSKVDIPKFLFIMFKSVFKYKSTLITFTKTLLFIDTC